MIRSLALAAVLLTLAIPALAGPRVCAWPPDGEIPPEVRAALARPGSPEDVPGGYEKLLELVLKNRADLAAGLISEKAADIQGGVAVVGTKRFPVFPVLYDNSDPPLHSAADLQQQLFDGPWPTGTLREYYEEVSYGLFSVDGEVSDWFTLSEEDSYYEGDSKGTDPADARTGELVLETLIARDGAVDFSQYDNDGPDGVPNTDDDDGYVDFVMFATADPGGECGGNGNMWSHAASLSYWGESAFVTDDPSNSGDVAFVRVNRYFISAGRTCLNGAMSGIGVTAHEFGHALGIKDLYDFSNPFSPDSEGLGHWGLMSSGNWNDQFHPAHMTAWTKERLGWLTYFYVTSDIEQLCLPPVETDPVAVSLWTHGQGGNEFFVVENRQRIGFDSELHGTGLVIYHVDLLTYLYFEDDNLVNGDEAHKAIDVECADAFTAAHVEDADHLDTRQNRGDAGDVWCTDTEINFDATSIPDTRAYNGSATEVAVVNIGDCTGDAGQPPGWICADYFIGVPQVASLCVHDCGSDDCSEITNCDKWWGSPDIWIDNDDDGDDDYPADDLENHLWFRVENEGPNTLANVQVRLYYADPALGQLWPSTGTLIGTKAIPVMNSGDVVEDFVVFEYPDPPIGVHHYCIGAIAVHGADPQNSEYPPNDNNVAQVNHQVLVARAGGKSAVAAERLDCGALAERSRIILYPGANIDGALAELRLGSPPDFDDVELPAGWTVDYDPGPHVIPPGNSLTTWITVSADNAVHGEHALIPLTLWDQINERPIGGMLMEYLIDCVDPAEPVIQRATCLPVRPDDLGGRNVLLAWPKTTVDQLGGDEIPKHYEVHRADNLGNPETLVARVAIDAEPDAPLFEWYDTVQWSVGAEFTYRVRTVDAGGGVGPFSAPVVVDCGEWPTGATETPRASALAQNQPNPFNPATVIRFTLDRAGPARLEVMDPAGRHVRTLVTGSRAAGEHEVVWDGRDAEGQRVPSGVYFYRLVASGVDETRKLMLVK